MKHLVQFHRSSYMYSLSQWTEVLRWGASRRGTTFVVTETAQRYSSSGNVLGRMLATLLLGIGMLWPGGARGQSADLNTLFPKPSEVPGWTLKDPPKRFAENQLFEYMDGAAE